MKEIIFYYDIFSILFFFIFILKMVALWIKEIEDNLIEGSTRLSTLFTSAWNGVPKLS